MIAEHLSSGEQTQSMCLLPQRGVSASLLLPKLETCLSQGHLPLTTRAMCSVIKVSSTFFKKNKLLLRSQTLLTLFLLLVPCFGATGTPPCATWCDQQWFLQKPLLHSKHLNVVFLSIRFTRLHQIHRNCFPRFKKSCV